MLSDNEPAAALFALDGGTVAYVCHTVNKNCGVCGKRLKTIPAMLLYRLPLDMYEAICRDCAIIICRAARVRIEHGESGG